MQLEYNLQDINLAAEQIIRQSPTKIILFNGEMGAGKTTLIKEIARQLGVLGATSSPTFSLVNEYHINDHELLYHFDLYRLESEIEAFDIGFEDYLNSGNWCIIEWPDKVINLIPEQHTKVNLEVLDNQSRVLTLS